MKKFTFSIAFLALSISSIYAQKIIQIQNPIDEDRIELISIPYAKFTKHFGVDSIFTLKDKATGKIYEHQLEKLGTNVIQNILVQIPITSKGKINLTVVKEQAPSFAAKAYARYIPERKDDFAWENDVVAFRYYGKALEGTSEDAQGIDFWAKRTTDLVINHWYKTNDYHQDHGQGLDYYSVGQTLGAGDLAIFLDDKIRFTKHYRSFEILDNGPLRTTFKLNFEPEIIEGNSISLSKTVTLDAGQNFNKIVVDLHRENHLTTPIVIGLAKRNETNSEVNFDTKYKTLAYWEPQIKDFGQTGTAVVLPNSKISFISNQPKQFLVKSSINNTKPFVYYNGAAWNKAGKITNADQWKDFVEDFAEGLRKPLKIKLK